VRIPVFVVLIAGLVTVVDMALNAWLHDLYKVLGLFIALIVVNCAILGRAEAYAVKNGVLASAVDGLAMGLGFTFALTVIGLIRELLGFLLAGKRVWEARPTKASETEEADPTTA
jgi:electron transport complex protein RnfE